MSFQSCPWPPFPELKTPRLILRHVRPADASALLDIFTDQETMRYWSRPVFEREEQASDYIRELQDSLDAAQGIRWGIALKEESERLIGFGGYYAWHRQHCRAEIHYILGRRSWGQGYATEALRPMVNFGFDHMSLHSIEAQVSAGNSDSERLLNRLGFMREGHLRENYRVGTEFVDSLIFSLLKRDWQDS